jgi:predicted DCC family thiol-disulfide oxidoreductase YuxK
VEDARPILFYDGACGLCSRSVRWALRHDRRGVVMFAPLQGTTYAAMQIPGKPVGLQTAVWHEGGRLFVRSDAGLRLMRSLGGLRGTLAGVLMVIPRGLRDWVYDRIAARRMAWFGGADLCQLPEPGQAGRFLP